MRRSLLLALAALVTIPSCGSAEPPPRAWDLLALVRDDPQRPARRSVRTHLEYGQTRHVVATRVPDTIAYPVDVPAGGVLDLGYAVQATSFMNFAPERARPTRFRIVLATGDDEHVLLDRLVDIRGRPDDRRWFDAHVDLGLYAGRRATLTVSVSPEGDGDGDTTALLSAPRVLAPARPDAPNLLFVTIDCLRADHVSAYGYARPTTPRLDQLSAEGVRFAHAYTAAPMTIPSLPQIFTSRLFPAARSATWLAPVVAAGIPNAAILNNVWFHLWLTLGRAPERNDDFDLLVAHDKFAANDITDRALDWLARHEHERFALYLHYLDAHSGYSLPPRDWDPFGDPTYAGRVDRNFNDPDGARAGRYDERDRARVVAFYDGSVRFIDEQVGRLLDHLRAEDVLDRTVVVVSADHGEELWDHGGFFHGQHLYDELLHVPLLVRLPGGARAGTVVERQVGSLDIAPSLLAWAGLSAPAGFMGRLLGDAVAHPDGPPEDHVATAVNVQFPTRYALRTPRHKLIDDVGPGTLALYDLVADPGEQRNIASEARDVVASLATRLAVARAPLAERGFQLRVVGPRAGGAHFGLTLEGVPEGTRFATIDRTDGPRDTVIELSSDGRTLHFAGETDARGRGVRFDRGPHAMPERAPDPMTIRPDPETSATIRLGAATRAAGAELNANDAALVTETAPACEPPDTGVRVCLWRHPVPATGSVPLDDRARQRLRALGYAQ
jgi:arylsulfatase A-like enzyme